MTTVTIYCNRCDWKATRQGNLDAIWEQFEKHWVEEHAVHYGSIRHAYPHVVEDDM